MVNKRLPIFYYPPIDSSISNQLSEVEDPSKVWLTEFSQIGTGKDEKRNNNNTKEPIVTLKFSFGCVLTPTEKQSLHDAIAILQLLNFLDKLLMMIKH